TGPHGITANRRAFTVMLRGALFRRVELAARRDWNALGEIDAESGFDAATWREAMEGYFDEYADLGIDAAARSPELIRIVPGDEIWSVRQILDDPDGNHDWAISAEVDVAASDETGEPVIRIVSVSD